MRLAALILLALAAFSARAAEPRKLIVICIDGLDARYIRDADRLHLKIPSIRKLLRQGAAADGVIGQIPDNSWASDTTIVTGVPPSVHQVMDDESPARTPRALTLWQAAAAAHRRTALLYWPATLGAQADYLCPEFWEGHATLDPPLEPISHKCTAGFPQKIAAAYPTFTKAQWSDASGLEALRYLMRSDPPDLTLVHLSDLEGEERETGALSIYSREVLENDDDLIGLALEKRRPETLVALVSDHGFETETYVVRPRVLVGSKAIDVKYGVIGATDAKAAAALRKLIGGRKTGIAREIPLAQVRRDLPDTGGWVAAFGTAPGYIPSDSATGRAVGPGSHKGVDSQWPHRPDFRATFVLSGQGIKPGNIGEISILDIAPTLADSIDVRLPGARGRSLWPKIAAAAR